MFSFTATAQFSGGDGTESTPYIITTASELAQLATYVNDGDEDYNDKFYILVNDIDLSDYQTGEGWIPIGRGIYTTSYNPFRGVFDGDNHIITGLFINTTSNVSLGLFGCTFNATIKNVGVVDANITNNRQVGNIYAGIIIGSSGGEFSVIDNCYSTGVIETYTLQGTSCAGCIVGGLTHNMSIISNCWSSAFVTVSTDKDNFDSAASAAGITGGNIGSITNSYFTGSVFVFGGSSMIYAGGISGDNQGYISDCWSSGYVKVFYPEGMTDTGTQYTRAANAGGIVGFSNYYSTTKNCYSTAIVVAVAEIPRAVVRAGGIMGGSLLGTVMDNIALNPIVICKGGDIRDLGRVAGTEASGISLSNNFGFAEMYNQYGTTEWEYKGATLRGGADITLEEILADGTFGGIFTSEGGWTTQNGKLPGFGAPEDLYLTDGPFVVEVFVEDKGVAKGETKTMVVNVAGFNLTGTATWTVEGGIPGTTITSDGILSVAAGEIAQKIIVTATSTDDNTKSGSGTVLILSNGGNGTEDEPYIITTAGEMLAISELVSKESILKEKHFKLGNDIDMSEYSENYNDGEGWFPIGTRFSPFSGTFDGDGYEISGLFSNINNNWRDDHVYAGLFGFAQGAVIKNIGIIDAVINSSSTGSNYIYAGGVAGRIDSGTVIDNCYATGSITAYSSVFMVFAGGIAATGRSSFISNSWTDIDINANGHSSSSHIGGIIGEQLSNSIIKNCYSKGSISAISNADIVAVGGIAGHNNGSQIINCWSHAQINASSPNTCRVGGIAGNNNNATSFITGCAALNKNLLCESPTMLFGRIAGRNNNNNDGALTNNIAFDEMRNPDGEAIWENIGENNLDGENINRLSINADGTLGGLFTEEDGWAIEDGKLPGIGQQVDMPLHLALYFITTEANPEEGGEVSGDGIFDYGENATVTAIANDGYYFVNWTEDGEQVSTDEVYTFEVTSSRDLVANFEPIIIYHTVTVIAGTGGTVEIVGYENLTEQIEAGTSVTVKATVNQNYDFIEWTDTVTGETISSLSVYSFTVSEDVTLVAHFELVGIKGKEISGFTIYPNPAHDELRIKNYELWDGLLSRTLSAVEVEVFDVFGRNVVGAYRIRPLNDNIRPITVRPIMDCPNEIVIDISNLPSGVYMIRIIESGRDAARHVSTQRFVKK